MNDKEFRKKCREIIYYQLDELDKYLESREGMYSTGFDSDIATAASLLYMAVNNTPSSNERAKKPCTFCDSSKPSNRDEAPSHYIYIDNKQNQLVEVHGDSETHISIKYCPFCRRKL